MQHSSGSRRRGDELEDVRNLNSVSGWKEELRAGQSGPRTYVLTRRAHAQSFPPRPTVGWSCRRWPCKIIPLTGINVLLLFSVSVLLQNLATRLLIMSQYLEQVPVRTVGSGTQYDGEVWYEDISSIKTVNGVSVKDKDKLIFKHGDKVTLEFEGKTFCGMIDFESSSPPESPRRKSTDVRHEGASRKRKLPSAGLDTKRKKRVVEKKGGEISVCRPDGRTIARVVVSRRALVAHAPKLCLFPDPALRGAKGSGDYGVISWLC